MAFNTQPILENDKVILSPLQEKDFEDLYSVSSDEEIWKQHPNKDRWKKDIFRNFFDGAIQSGGAFKIIDKESKEIAGSTRIYDFDETDESILIGYTFFATKFWGKGYNLLVKKLLLDYLFQFVSRVYFHIGATNFRSQKSISKLGAMKTGEKEIAYFGEQSKLNFIYCITKEDWLKRK